MAVAASLLTTIYHMLRRGTVYTDLGSSHFDRLDKTRAVKRLIRRLEHLGYQVQLQPAG